MQVVIVVHHNYSELSDMQVVIVVDHNYSE